MSRAFRPDPTDVITAAVVVIEGAGGGEFIYDANGNLREAEVGATTTDPVQGLTCPTGHSFWNGFGAIITLISNANDAIFLYFDNGNAVQGVLVSALASAAGNDPVNGAAYRAGFNTIDPVFGAVMNVVGATIDLFGVSTTQQARVHQQDGSASTSPSVQVLAPEQGQSGHVVLLMQGTSPDGTHLGQLLIAREPTGFTAPTPVTSGLVEIQAPSSGLADSILQLLAASGGVASDNMLGARITGDPNNRLRVNADGSLHWGPGSATQDTNLYRHAVSVLRTDDALALTNVAAPAAIAAAPQLYAASGALHVVEGSGLDGSLIASLTDTGSRTVTQAATTQLGGAFTIPAGDEAVGTKYRYEAGGFGTWGATQQQLTLVELLSGTNINQINIAAAAFAASAPFDWRLIMEILITATGAGGTCRALLTPVLNVNNAAVVTAAPNFATGVRQAGGVAINTTISRVLQLNALWASTTGAPTITCDRSSFERIGP